MLEGKIAIVTGASRGIGAGISRELASNGATVILAARTENSDSSVRWSRSGGPKVSGSLAETLNSIQAVGGSAESYPIDLLKNKDIENLVNYVTTKYRKVDLLVNCAMGFPESYKASIWSSTLDDWMGMMDVGVRSKFVLTHFVSKTMIEQGSGLIVNISAAAAKDEYYSPMFRMAMSTLDRMTSAIAEDLRPHGVSAVSIWPRWVRTERVLMACDDPELGFDVTPADLKISDSAEFTGRGIAHIAVDPDLLSRSGLVFPIVQLAHEYEFNDIDGSRPPIDDYTKQWVSKLARMNEVLKG